MNAIILDWDSTLFPTKWLNDYFQKDIQKDVNNKKNDSKNDSKISNVNKDKKNTFNIEPWDSSCILLLKDLDSCLYTLFTSFNKKKNKIYILTLSTNKWIDVCLQYLPNTKKLFTQLEINIIYAYNEKHSNGAFMKVQQINKILAHQKYNKIFGCGDSSHDKKAFVIISYFQEVFFMKVRGYSIDETCEQVIFFLQEVLKRID